MSRFPPDERIETARAKSAICNEIANGRFKTTRVATTGCEIRDPEGRVIAWAVDEPWAALIAALLNRAEMEGLSGMFGMQQRLLEKEATP